MNNFVGLTKQVFSGVHAESIYTQLSASIQKEMDQPFQMPLPLFRGRGYEQHRMRIRSRCKQGHTGWR